MKNAKPKIAAMLLLAGSLIATSTSWAASHERKPIAQPRPERTESQRQNDVRRAAAQLREYEKEYLGRIPAPVTANNLPSSL